MEVAVERYSWLCFEVVSVRAGACPARNDHPIKPSNPFDHHRHVVVVVVVVSSFRIQGTQEPVSVPQFLGKGTDVTLHKSHK